jgi:hypothetical protein
MTMEFGSDVFRAKLRWIRERRALNYVRCQLMWLGSLQCVADVYVTATGLSIKFKPIKQVFSGSKIQIIDRWIATELSDIIFQ